jgi:TonB dependent receptor
MFSKVFIIVMLLCFAKTIFAFQIATLEIKIVDQTGDFVFNSTVRLKFKDTLIEEVKQLKTGEVNFSLKQQGKYLFEVEAIGFKPKTQEIELKAGKNNLTIVLELKEIIENVKIEKDQQEKSVDEAFSSFLTRNEIENMPDSPEEIEKELKRRYGEDTIIRVNGFTGKIPTKSQISSIKVSQSSFDAENHELGFNYVDIFTKVGKEQFTGSIAFSFNDESLNARNPFSTSRLPEQRRVTDFFLLGPIKENSSSFSISYFNTIKAIKETLIARLPNNEIINSKVSKINVSDYSFDVTQNLKNNHIAKFNYLFNLSKSDNLGIGGFNLPERSFFSVGKYHQIRISESGYIGNRFLNDFRFEFISEKSKTTPYISARSITVLDAFARGGSDNRNENDNTTFSIADSLIFGIKQHALKIGVWINLEKRDEISEQNINGTFIFSSITDFLANRPSIYTESPNPRNVNISQFRLAGFVQDDWRIRKNFNLSFGLRYEWQNNLSDKNNFSPRIGFSWSPNKKGNLTFRGGAGIFYNWLETYHLTTIESQSIEQPSEIIITNPSFPNPFLSGSSQLLSQSYWKRSENLKNPYIFHTSIGLENRLPKNLFLRVNYTFQKGVHQFRTRNINAPLNGMRPNSSFGNINQFESSGFFAKNGLKIALGGNFFKNVAFNIDYTLSKKVSDIDDVFSLPSDNYNLLKDRSFASDDQRHRVYTSVNWRIKETFQISTIFTANSSLPYTITTGIDENNDTSFNDRPFGISRNSERGNWNNQADLAFSWLFSFMNRKNKSTGTTAVSTSSSEANTIFGATDEHKRFSAKTFIRVENIFNQTNYKTFSGVETSSFFKQPLSAINPRKIYIGIRFNF